CVAEALIKQMPKALQDLLPSGAITLAALHDVGKISPGFQQQCDDWCRQTVCIRGRFETNHALVTQCFLDRLKESDGWRAWAEAVGAHHGWYAPERWGFTKEDSPQWQKARHHLLEKLSSQICFGPLPNGPPRSEAEKWFLAG